MKTTTQQTYQQDVINSSKVVLVDIWGPLCAPCKGMEPILEDISKETADWAEIIKLDSSTEMDLVQQLDVRGLPTYLVYNHGKLLSGSAGATSKLNLLESMRRAQAS
jgi:thioredoxin 1